MVTAWSEERLARAALGRLGEPGDPRIARAVGELGAIAVYDGLRGSREPFRDPALTGSGTDEEARLVDDVAARLAGIDPAAELDSARAGGFRFVIPGDDEWPNGVDDLDRCPVHVGRGGAPLGLWVRGVGHLREATARAVAIVGSRSATSYGTELAGSIAAGVSQAGFTVVSGAAFGIDQAAHRGALALRGSTVAVLACGIDRVYPAGHRQLLDYIADTGVVISESPIGGSPTKVRFLSRNRIIAALGRGTVVVEAALRSGALNTATWSELLNRSVLGVPGPVTSAPSAGVHELIRVRGAGLVTSAGDVLEVVSSAGEHLQEPKRAAETPQDALTVTQRQVLDAVPVVRPAPLRNIARTSGLARATVAEALTVLGTVGLVVEHDGWFVLPPGASSAP